MVDESSLSAVLGDFARTMVIDLRMQDIVDHLVVRIVDLVSVSGAGVTLLSPGATPPYVAASDPTALHYERLQNELGQGPGLTAYETGQQVTIADLTTDSRYPVFGPAAAEAGVAAAFTFPLQHEECCLGALCLYRSTPGDLDAGDLAAAQTLADVTAAYLVNAQARARTSQLMDELRHRGLHDALTGLPNRVLLQQRLEDAARRAQRSRSTAAVLFADLDEFKHINDTYGHTVGDELLIAVAQRLSRLVRPGDTLARVSGDEFVFLCEELTQPSDVELLATRIDEALSLPFTIFGAALIPVTASVGIAYSGPGVSIGSDLMMDADRAMYVAKRQRRTLRKNLAAQKG